MSNNILLTVVALLLSLTAQAGDDGRGLARAGGVKRVALVIGNDRYQHVDPLKNAVADARSMATALERTGFAVTLKVDADLGAMKQAVRQFKASLSGGDEAVLFYSGHGVQLGAANYLLPVDIASDSAEQVKDDSIPLQRLLDDLQDQKVKFALAIIDACRDDPFKGNGRSIGGTRGLAPTSAANGQMVIFSAGAGQQALDKLGNADRDVNGVFTRVFLQEMDKPGIEVHQVLRNVRSRVVAMAKSINRDQMPALYDQVEGDFYFKPGSQVASLEPVPVPAGNGVSLDDLKKQQESRGQWEKWQQAMKADYDKIVSLNAEADLQLTAWERFLANYGQDNPYSAEDDTLRAQAQSRKQGAEAQQRQVAVRIEKQREDALRQRQQVEAAQRVQPKVTQLVKDKLVLMPLHVPEEVKNLEGAIETALVEGLQQKYEVLSGEQVARKAHEIFKKELRKKEYDETRCLQGIAKAFQSELLATANVAKREDGYLLTLSILNIDNVIVYSKSLPCKDCDSYQVVDRLKELSGTLTPHSR